MAEYNIDKNKQHNSLEKQKPSHSDWGLHDRNICHFFQLR